MITIPTQEVSPLPNAVHISTAESSAGHTLAVHARGVSKSYVGADGGQPVHALIDVDLAVAPGEFVAVMGPSGNGKSTLLNCLSGLDSIDGGQVHVAGEDVHRLSDRRRSRFRAATMGFVFQSFNLVNVLTATENVELPLLALGRRPAEARRQASQMLGRVGLASRGDHRPGALSGGEQQRVAVARALVAGPAVVWADEPTGSLDTATAGAVLELFEEVHANGQTVVMVTHDPAIGQRSDRVVWVRNGRVDLSGSDMEGAR